MLFSRSFSNIVLKISIVSFSHSSVPSSATCGSEIGTTYLIGTPVSLLLDVAFVFVIYMVNAVNAVMVRLTMSSPSDSSPVPPPSIAAVQSALDSFLTNWFSEQISDKEEAVSYRLIFIVRNWRKIVVSIYVCLPILGCILLCTWSTTSELDIPA